MSRLRRRIMRDNRYYHDTVYTARFSLKVDSSTNYRDPGFGFMLGLGNTRSAIGLNDRTGYSRVSINLAIKLKITERSTGNIIYSNKFIYDHPNKFSTAMKFQVDQSTENSWNVYKDIWDNTGSSLSITPNTEYWVINGRYPLMSDDFYDIELIVSAPKWIASVAPIGILDSQAQYNEIVYISTYHIEADKSDIPYNCLNKVDFVFPDPETTNKGILISISKHANAEE